MEKEFVPYPLALRLKALGFDEPCFHLDGLGKVSYAEFGYGATPIPLYSQAFRWFREKHGVHSSPRKYDETQWWAEWGTWTSSIGTFEEAELAWLEKLIEIVETKSE
jgi:hypothetical protein